MKKNLFILTMLLCIAVIPEAFAYNFQSGGIYYDITGSSPNTVAVTYATGSYNSYSGNVVIPSTVTYNGTTYTVTAIGNNAFRSCSNLTGVTIPNTVTSIGEYAFSSCSHITSVTIPNGVETIGVRAFYNCSQLSTLTIPNGVEIIGASAFYHCNLHTVTIPASVTSIGSDAFSCSNLDSVFFKATNCSSAANAFENCSHLTYLNIGSNVQTIPTSTFAYCNALRSIYIPSSVSTIGTNPFHHCHGLDTIIVEEGNSVYTSGNHYNAIIHSATHTLVTGCKSTVIPNSVTQIGGYAFAGCTGLTGPYTIPNQIIVIGASAYSDCTSLTSLTIGHNVDSIGNSAFSGCSAISSVAFNADSCRYMGAGFSSCNSFSTLAIGNNVKAIPAYAFIGCSHLTGMLVIPDSVKTIGEYAFNGCSGLTLLSIGNSVTSIGNSAFYSCNEMGGTLTIPQSVKSIGSSAFYNCPGFTSLVFNADSCATGSFSGCSNVSTLTIGDNVKIIPESAFSGLSLITGTLTLPSTLMYIGGSAFSNCSGLTGLIAIPDSVQAIGSYALQNCSGLTSLTIGKAVSNIGSYAFQNCSGLASIAFNADSCVSMGIGSNDNPYPVFSGCTNAATLSIGENVKTIPAYAFYNLTGLTGPTTIPDSVQNIGHYAFQNCSGLTSLTIGKAVSTIGHYAFQNCSGLTSLTIGKAVSTIGDYAFQNCIGLTHVTFNADSCTYMGFYNPYHGGYDGSVFKGCDSLSTLILGENVKNIPDYAFFNCSKLNGKLTFSRVTLIGTSAFEGCSELDSLIIGRTVSSIGTHAFKNCIGLSYVEYNADSCNSSGYLFTGCTAPASLVIGENVKSIPDYCFRNFTGLSGTLVIPDSVKVIGSSAFSECTGLDSVIIGKSVISMGRAFGGCSNLSHVTFNADSCIDNYGYNAWFYGCDSLFSLTIGENVKIIPNSIFSDCSNLSGCINIPNSVKTIGTHAFRNCYSIDSLIIGKVVTSIGSDAFENCSGLSHVVFNADSCTAVGINLVSGSIGGTIFNGCTFASSLVIGDNVKNLPQNIFYGLSGLQGTLVIPDSVVFIGSCAFKNCSNLTNLVIGKSVREIQPGYNAQYSAFAGCGGITSLSFNADSCIVAGNANYPAFKVLSNLTTLSIGDNVKVIPDYAFSNSKLTGELVIPNSVKYIGRSAFEWCNKLNGALIIPNSVKTIEDNAFKWTNFDSLVIGKNVSLIDTGAFTGCPHLKHVSYNADSCSCAEGISNRPFSNCDSIVSLTISDNVKIIPAYVFNGLNHITGELTIPDSVKIIGTQAFANCKGISKLILSRSVDSLGASAFANCTGINSIFSYNKTPPAPALNSSNPFDNVGRNFFVHVPCGTADAYRAAWRYNQNVSSSYFNYYADDLQPYLFTVLSDDTLKGSVQITAQPSCWDPAVIEATPNFFYVFDHWSDGNTDNPRTITLSQDTTLVAHFREYDLNINCDTNYGHIVFLQVPTAENPQAVVQVEPNPCYLFGYWTDYKHSGSSVWPLNEEYDNPRTITLSQDTTMEVSFRYAHPVDISSDRTSLCVGDSTVLKGVTYPEAWSGNTAIPSNSVTEGFLWVRYIPTGSGTYQRDTLGLEDSIVVSTAGIYRVMGIDSTGCIAYSTISIEVHPNPTIMISGETEICAGNSTVLTAGLYEFSEDFTNGIPSNWTTSNETLETYTLSGNGGTALLFPAYNLPNNSMAELILPNINMKQFDKPYMQFKMAYRGKLTSCNWNYSDYGYTYQCDTIRNEDLSVMLSADNGSTWVEVFRASNDYDYYSLGGTTEAFYPSSLQTEYTNLSNFSNYENVIIKFVFTGGQGNNMWLDNVRIYSTGYEYLPTVMWSNGSWEPAQTFDSTGTWQVTVSNIIGWDEYGNVACSSTDSVTVTVLQPDTVDITVNSPDNYYVINDETFCTSGDYTQSLQNIHGCDSVINLHLTLAPRDTVFITDTVCGGWHEIYWEDSSYDTTYTVFFDNAYDESVYNIAGYGGWGDAIVESSGNVYGFYVSGEYYRNDSLWIQYDETRTLQAVSGCDSVVKKHHYVKFSDWYGLRDTACGSYVWQGDTIVANPYYTNRWLETEGLTNLLGCDSTVRLRLTLLPAIEETDTVTACDSYSWNGITYTESGVYTQNSDTTLQGVPACKLTTLHLTINPSVTELVEATACDSYTWNDSIYTTSGEYTQTFTAANGCDSTVTLQLTINESKHTDTTAESCGTYTWNEITYTTSGEYTQNFTAANGCDSTVTLQLTILPLPTPNITGVTTVCEGQTATLNATGGVSYLWEDGTTTNTYPATVSGLYTVTVTNAEGCSATASTTVTVNPLPEVVITGSTAICPGGSTVLTATGADSYQWSNGSTNPSIPVNMFGQYSVIGTSSAGCFSTASVTVLVSQPPVITISGNTDICAGESTTLTANGGVSYMWSNGSTADTLVATTGGTWQVIGYNADGCSNMASVTVNLWQPATTNLYITSFDSCYMWFGTPRCESGDYTHTLQTIHGCDSVIILHLTLEDAITTEFSATSCDSYTWNGITYSQSGNYTQNFTAVNGNDSIVTLHLTINYSVSEVVEATACDSYLWNDSNYTVSGDYIQIFTAANGCDSVVTLHLTINHPVAEFVETTVCDSYEWNGQSYVTSGDYTQTFTAANGCDSVVTLHLIVNDTKHVEFADSTCTTYTWNGQSYAQSGDYTQNFTAANGCDSVVTLHLTIVPTITPVIAVNGSLTACGNGSATLTVPGNYSNFVWSTGAVSSALTVNEAGYYWVTATDVYGCEGVSEMVQLGGSVQIDETPAICMVGVDNDHNLVVWEPLTDPDVSEYRIYREDGQANIFEPLAVIPASNSNAYVDATADPSVRAYRYKITAADTCGGETPMSAFHKTVHLTINQGLGNSYNLIWTPYEGFEFSSYKLYRGTANNNLQLIQTMPSTLTSYTDNNPAGDALFYQIEVVMMESCVQQTRDITYTGARSNIVYNGVAVTTEVTIEACDSYDWNGQILTSSGDYTQNFVSELGYDSVVTLHLTINPSVTEVIEVTTPDSCYTWNGQDYCTSGTYTQTLQTVHGCDSVVTMHLTITVGVNDYDGFDFKVYPNPTTGVVNVQITNPNSPVTEFHVYDAYGKLIRVVDVQTAQIDLSHYASGVYFIKAVSDGNVVAVRKVVKQ